MKNHAQHSCFPDQLTVLARRTPPYRGRGRGCTVGSGPAADHPAGRVRLVRHPGPLDLPLLLHGLPTSDQERLDPVDSAASDGLPLGFSDHT